MSDSDANQKPAAKKRSPAEEASPKVAAEQFETAMAELQNVVSQLEQGNLTLAQSLQAYEQGVGWLKTCYQGLQEVEQQIRILTKVDANGQVSWEDFDATASEQQTEGQSPRANSRSGNGEGRRKRTTSEQATNPKNQDESTQPRLF